jgi:hypothetical protein
VSSIGDIQKKGEEKQDVTRNELGKEDYAKMSGGNAGASPLFASISRI